MDSEFEPTFSISQKYPFQSFWASSSSERKFHREIQLLKILGVTSREARNMLSMEFGLLGLIAGTLGVAGAGLLSGLILVFAFRLEFSIDPIVIGAWFVGVPIITTVVGWVVFRGLTAQKTLL